LRAVLHEELFSFRCVAGAGLGGMSDACALHRKDNSAETCKQEKGDGFLGSVHEWSLSKFQIPPLDLLFGDIRCFPKFWMCVPRE
jgi:hypothetical protein